MKQTKQEKIDSEIKRIIEKQKNKLEKDIGTITNEITDKIWKEIKERKINSSKSLDVIGLKNDLVIMSALNSLLYEIYGNKEATNSLFYLMKYSPAKITKTCKRYKEERIKKYSKYV